MFHILGGLLEEVLSKVYDGEPAFGSFSASKKGKGRGIVEEEVLLCKNNVCVHLRSEDVYQEEQHQPGYFTLKYVHRDTTIPDVILCWVPNSLLAAGIADDDGTSAIVASETSAEGQNEQADSVTNASDVEQTKNVESESKITTNEANGEDIASALSAEDGPVPRDDDEMNTVKDNVNKIAMEDLAIAAIDKPLSVPVQCPATTSDLNVSPARRNETFNTPLGDVFCVNLQEMKTLKLFFTDSECSCGHFVVGNNDNHYKVFHFHHNGLDKLSEIFDNWDGCTVNSPHNDDPSETRQKIYVIKKQKEVKSPGKSKKVDVLEAFAEEGNYSAMNQSIWRSYLNPLGQMEDVNNFRKHVFFGGLSPEIRSDAWKFLLYCYPVQSTSFERDGPLKKEKEDAYKSLDNRRLALNGEEYEKFWKEVQFTVDKDVVRTDRSSPFYAGQDNPNVQKMRNILLNYAIYNPVMGYTQGMSDLVAPLLTVIQDEVETFWSFVGLMEFSMFATTPTDNSMEKSLGFLKELLRLMYPDFYIHCLLQDEDLSLLFCHRWLVLCFKREFIEPETLVVWETCWSRYLTDYFHIFIAVAILCLYGKKCIEKKMAVDKMLEYFSDLAMKFDGSAVLKKARGILYRFRRMRAIPCTLEGLLSGPGIWDGGIAPDVECISHHRRCCQDKKVMLHYDVVTQGPEVGINDQSQIEKPEVNEISPPEENGIVDVHGETERNQKEESDLNSKEEKPLDTSESQSPGNCLTTNDGNLPQPDTVEGVNDA